MMAEFWTQTFCDSAGLCGWPYALHHLARAGFHLALVDPMMATVALAGWTLAADAGLSPRRRGVGFIRWVWITALLATFLREPADAAAVDWYGKSYFDFATHAAGIRFWLEVHLWLAPRMYACRQNVLEQRRNMKRRWMRRFNLDRNG